MAVAAGLGWWLLAGRYTTVPQVSGISAAAAQTDLRNAGATWVDEEVVVDGTLVTTYHYVMTEDFPYSVSCFRATPSAAPGRNAGP